MLERSRRRRRCSCSIAAPQGRIPRRLSVLAAARPRGFPCGDEPSSTQLRAAFVSGPASCRRSARRCHSPPDRGLPFWTRSISSLIAAPWSVPSGSFRASEPWPGRALLGLGDRLLRRLKVFFLGGLGIFLRGLLSALEPDSWGSLLSRLRGLRGSPAARFLGGLGPAVGRRRDRSPRRRLSLFSNLSSAYSPRELLCLLGQAGLLQGASRFGFSAWPGTRAAFLGKLHRGYHLCLGSQGSGTFAAVSPLRASVQLPERAGEGALLV